MKIEDEGQLYDIVTKAFNKALTSPGGPFSNPLEDALDYKKIEIGSQQLHLVLHAFCSSQRSVDFMHTSIVPEIKKNSSSWILFKEGAHQKEFFKRYSGSRILEEKFGLGSEPDVFYFRELAKLFQMPYLEASVNDFSSYELRRHFTDRGVSEQNFYRYTLRHFLGSGLCLKRLLRSFEEDIENLQDFCRVVGKELKKPAGYVKNLFFAGALTLDQLEEFDKFFHEYIRKRFHRIKETYAQQGKRNVLVVALQQNESYFA